MNRFDTMQKLLDTSKYFKLVCGAGNEDAEEVKRLTVLYTLAGAKGMDVSATVEVVKSCMEGIDIAFDLAKEFGVRAYPTVYGFKNGEKVEFNNRVTESNLNDFYSTLAGH